MKKTCFHGNNSNSLRSGFAGIWAVSVLLILMLFPMSLLVLEKMRLDFTQKKCEQFYEELNHKNAEIEKNIGRSLKNEAD